MIGLTAVRKPNKLKNYYSVKLTTISDPSPLQWCSSHVPHGKCRFWINDHYNRMFAFTDKNDAITFMLIFDGTPSGKIWEEVDNAGN